MKILRKINGRIRPAEDKEVGNIYGKTFVCEKCSAERVLDNVEFGATVFCETCGSEMHERQQ
jgi:hypothetical protein